LNGKARKEEEEQEEGEEEPEGGLELTCMMNRRGQVDECW